MNEVVRQTGLDAAMEHEADSIVFSSLQAAADEQNFLAAILEASDDAILTCTPACMIRTWNRGAAEIFGYSSEEAIGQALALLMAGNEQSTLLPFAEQVLRNRTISRHETVCQGRDGRMINVCVTASPIRNHAGEVVAMSLILRDTSDLRRAENALRASEERFRAIADGCPLMIWITDTDGKNQFVNRAFEEFAGASCGPEWILHPEDAAEYTGAFQRAVLGHTPFKRETRARRADGEWRWLESCAEPRLSATGEYLGHVGLSPDITERKRTEQALELQNSLIHAIQDVTLDGILLVNDDDVLWHNKRFMDVWKIPVSPRPEHVVGSEELFSAVLDRVKDPGVFSSRVRELQADPDAIDTCEIELKDGRILERYTTSLRCEGKENLPGRAVFIRDITERKQAEQALRSSEEKFRQLAENIHEIFWMLSPQADECLYVSPAYEQIWGRTCASIYKDPTSWQKAIHPEDRARAHAMFARQIQGETVDSQYRIQTPDGQEKWILDRAFPVRDHTGKLIRIVGIAEEITEQKRYESELIYSREGAEAANEAKSRFLANMSHEIRNPMNAVLGMIQLLLRTELTDKQRKYANVAGTSGRTLLGLIDSILDLSKVEAGKMTLEKRTFDLRQAVSEVVQSVRGPADARGLRIHSKVLPQIPPLLAGDDLRLQQVLTNLCANAVKFTEAGEITLTATLVDLRDEDTAKVRFTITDTGIGISPTQAEVLFSPFVQADTSTTRKYGGTGLGLAICRHLVGMMGGTIGVESREGEGSTFWFTALLEVPRGGAQLSADLRGNEQFSQDSGMAGSRLVNSGVQDGGDDRQ